MKDMTNQKLIRKFVDISGKVMKPTCQIGNTVLISGIFGACVLFPPLAIPLKICAGLSALAISDLITHKTDEHIDNCCKEALDILLPIAEAMDNTEA